MRIKMAGIDYHQASLSQREVFAFSRTQAQEAMQTVIQTKGISSCVIISTCNRVEIWIYEEDKIDFDLIKVLCKLKKVSFEEYRDLIITREGLEAIRHLFETTCGFNSQMWGEDQVLSQIKFSIELARQAKTTNEVIEKFFQFAITCAKKIKSSIRLTALDVSIAMKARQKISEHFPSLVGLKCLVLGNGEIGRMMASLLVECGAQVTVSLREYKHKMSIVPEGCLAINYENCIYEIKHSDLIVSATSSPHFVIKMEDVVDSLADKKKRVFVDLAVPRDINPQLAEYENVTLLDIDTLGGSTRTKESDSNLLKAKEIIEHYIIEFIKWNKIRDVLLLINHNVSYTPQLINYMLRQEINRLNPNTQKTSILEKNAISLATEALQQIMFHREQELLSCSNKKR